MTYQILLSNGGVQYVNDVLKVIEEGNRVIFVGLNNIRLAVFNFDKLCGYKPFEKKK